MSTPDLRRSPSPVRRWSLVLAGATLALTAVVAGPALAGPTVTHAAAVAPSAAPGVDGDGLFTFAVIPDTQMEVTSSSDPRFLGRVQWLESSAARLDLRYITHVGDVVNWDTADHAQYQATAPAVAALDAGGVPWSFSIGNHDSLATGPGGSARPGGNARVDIRSTQTFNAYYGVDHAKALGGTYEPGKIDNSFSTFTAEGTKWLVLNLELWPRTGAVAWAQGVVASHPDSNVVVVTHAFLTGGGTGSVQQDNGGYGANSPQYVLDNLVLKYANVRFVFSGHAGGSDRADLTGVHGNPVTVLQTCYHDPKTNPTRLVTVDTASGSYSSVVYAPATNQTYRDGSASTRNAMAWVRPTTT